MCMIDVAIDLGFLNMVIDISIEPIESFDNEGDLVNEWESVIYIYEK
jgi:hypothetical protein